MRRRGNDENATTPTKISDSNNSQVDSIVKRKEEIEASADVIELLDKTPQRFKANPKKENDKTRVRHYKLRNKQGVVRILKTSGFTIYDAKEDRRRQVRYAENEESIFVDEQGEFIIRKPIKFKEGEMFVSHDYPALIKLMEMHPENEKNGGTLFYEVDAEKESKQEVMKTFDAADAIIMVREKPLNELMPIVLHLGINTNQTVFEIKRDLLQFAKSDPDAFIKRFDSPLIKLKAIVKNAADFSIIRIDEEGVYWTDSNKLIITNPSGKDPLETMAIYLTTERGIYVLEELQKQLATL